MNGEEMKRLIADDEDRVLLLRFPKGWGLWVDLGGALLYEVLRSDLFFFEMNQEFWQEGDCWLKYPLPRSGRCTTLGADYPPPTWGGLSAPWENFAPRADTPGESPPPSLGLALEELRGNLGGRIIRPPPGADYPATSESPSETPPLSG